MFPYLPSKAVKLGKVLAVSVALFLVLLHVSRRGDVGAPRDAPHPFPNYTCPAFSTHDDFPHVHVFDEKERDLSEPTILLLLDNANSRHGRLITNILNASKCEYKIESFSKNLPQLEAGSRGRYSVIIFENFYRYINLPRWNRQIVDKYCREHRVPILSFVPGKTSRQERVVVKGSNLTLWHNEKVSKMRISSVSRIPFIARPEVLLDKSDVGDSSWTLFQEQAEYETVMAAQDEFGRRKAAVMRDKGESDGVEKIFFGHNLTEWMVGLAFVDSLRYGSKGRCGAETLERTMQVDIDDVFVGSRGSRMLKTDVDALVDAQRQLRTHINNFTFMLGFSGAYFLHGDDAEDEGDRALLDAAEEFYWFPHMWKHNHPQEMNESALETAMLMNRQFSIEHGLRVPFHYAISPQHGGVFPIHQPLYNAWKKIWAINVSATEEYPHQKPACSRRGFVHHGIHVLPRQTCGLYTHTLRFHLYPGGVTKLLRSIRGGELFWTILLNPVSIFMTHQQNYAHDRLALYTFHNVVAFIRCWTRLSLQWRSPQQNALHYFSAFPNERSPLWTNPCEDVKHTAILPPSVNCSNLTLPNVLIVGPQKTGTTALLFFLLLHPNVSTSVPLPKSFEETQFFSGENYERGVEWYSQLFHPSGVVVDKSATYMDSPHAPTRAAALLPHAHIVILLEDPALRAYSWYQHMRMHNDSRLEGTKGMEDVLDEKTEGARKIKQRCVSGGKYAVHLERWMHHFPLSRITLVDATELKKKPVKVLEEVSVSLNLTPFAFSDHVKFVDKKGFFCKKKSSSSPMECLGWSKGRAYPPLSASLRVRLCSLFLSHNEALHSMLLRHRLPIPSWLPSSLQCINTS